MGMFADLLPSETKKQGLFSDLLPQEQQWPGQEVLRGANQFIMPEPGSGEDLAIRDPLSVPKSLLGHTAPPGPADPQEPSGLFTDLLTVPEGQEHPAFSRRVQESPRVDIYGPQDVWTSQGTSGPRMGLAERGAKGYANEALLDVIERNRPSTATLESVDVMNRAMQEANLPEQADTWSMIRSLPRLWWSITKNYYSPKTEVARESVQEMRPAVTFDVPEATTTGEKVVDVGAGLGGFLTQLLIAKKMIPATTVLSDAVAWEVVNQAGGGIPGQGAAMSGTLGAVGGTKLPTAAKLGIESGLFAGLTASQGGDMEDILISAGIPVVMGGGRAVANWAGFTKQRPKFSDRVDRTTPKEHRAQAGKARRSEVMDAWNAYAKNPNDPQAVQRWRDVTAKYGGAGSTGIKPEPQPAAQPVTDFGKYPLAAPGAVQPGPAQPVQPTTKAPTDIAVPRPAEIGTGGQSFTPKVTEEPTFATQPIQTETPAPVVETPPKAQTPKQDLPPKAEDVQVEGPDVQVTSTGETMGPVRQADRPPQSVPETAKKEPLPVEEQAQAVEKRRRAEMGKATKAIKGHPLYKLAQEQAGEEAFSTVGLARYYVPETYKGEIEAYAGEGKSKLGEYITHDKNRGQHWDEAAAEMGWPDDINGFLERLKGAVEANRKAGKTKFDQALAEQAARGGDPELELLLLKRDMLSAGEDVGDVNMAISKALAAMQEDYALEQETVDYLRDTHTIGGSDAGHQISVGAAAINWKSRRGAIDRAQKASARGKRPMYVVQGQSGKFQARQRRPKRGNYTLVDMSQPFRDQVRFVKQASVTAEDAFDVGEHPKENITRLSAIERLKRQIKAKNADTRAIQNELHAVAKKLPKAEQSRVMAMLKEVRPDRQTKTNLRNLGKAIARTERILRDVDRKAAIGELRKTWGKIKKKYRRGEKALGKLDEFTRKAVVETMEGIDTKGALTAAKRQDLASLAKHLNRLSAGMAASMRRLNADKEGAVKIPDGRIEELERLAKQSYTSMTGDEIREITQALQHLTHQFELKNKIIRRMGNEDTVELKTRILDEIAPTKKFTKATQKDTDLDKALRKGMASRVLKEESAHLDTLVEMVTHNDAAELKQVLVDDLHDGHRDTVQMRREAFDYIRDRLDEIGFTLKDFKALQDKHTVTIGGQKIDDVTTDILLGLYNHSRNDANLKRLLTTRGLKIGRRNLPVFKDIGELDAALLNLTDKQKAFAELFAEVNGEVLAPRINEISKRLEGYELATDPVYYPIHRAMPMKVSGKGVGTESSIEQSGRFQPRTGGTHRIRLTPYTQELVETVQVETQYAGMAAPMRNARAIINSRRIQEKLEDTGNADALRAIVTVLRNTQKFSSDQSIVEMLGQRLLSKFARSVLSVRISTIGAQVASYPAAMSEVNPKYFTGARPSKARIEKMQEMSPLFWERWSGGKINLEVGAIHAQHASENLLFGHLPGFEKPMKALIWGDKQALAMIHQAVEREMADDPVWKDKTGTPEFDEAVIRRTEYVVRRSQPMWDMLDRSALSGSSGLFTRSVLMFRSAREMQWNILLRSANRYAKSEKKAADKKEYANAVGAVTGANFLIAGWKHALKWGLRSAAVLMLAALGLRDKDEERDQKQERKLATELALDTTANVISLAPGGNVLASLGKDMVHVFQGESTYYKEPYDNPLAGFTKDSYEVAINATDAIQSYLDEEKYKSGPHKGEPKWKYKAQDAAWQAASIAARATGVPYSGPQQELVRPVKKALKEGAKTRAAKKAIERRRKHLEKLKREAENQTPDLAARLAAP